MQINEQGGAPTGCKVFHQKSQSNLHQKSQSNSEDESNSPRAILKVSKSESNFEGGKVMHQQVQEL
jgi:hypothetical protein